MAPAVPTLSGDIGATSIYVMSQFSAYHARRSDFRGDGFIMSKEEKANIALTHARDYGIFHAGLRVKHFNFFVIVFIALLAGVINKPDQADLIAYVGMVVAVASFFLDTRYMALIKNAHDEFKKIEPMFGSDLHTEHGRGITTVVYRSIYVGAFLVLLLQAFGIISLVDI